MNGKVFVKSGFIYSMENIGDVTSNPRQLNRSIIHAHWVFGGERAGVRTSLLWYEYILECSFTKWNGAVSVCVSLHPYGPMCIRWFITRATSFDLRNEYIKILIKYLITTLKLNSVSWNINSLECRASSAVAAVFVQNCKSSYTQTKLQLMAFRGRDKSDGADKVIDAKYLLASSTWGDGFSALGLEFGVEIEQIVKAAIAHKGWMWLCCC